jgi:hypothetical protein
VSLWSLVGALAYLSVWLPPSLAKATDVCARGLDIKDVRPEFTLPRELSITLTFRDCLYRELQGSSLSCLRLMNLDDPPAEFPRPAVAMGSGLQAGRKRAASGLQAGDTWLTRGERAASWLTAGQRVGVKSASPPGHTCGQLRHGPRRREPPVHVLTCALLAAVLMGLLDSLAVSDVVQRPGFRYVINIYYLCYII